MLSYFGFRFYDAGLSRWVTQDPAGYVDGPNLYAFVGNRPTSASDPWGLDFWDDWYALTANIVFVGVTTDHGVMERYGPGEGMRFFPGLQAELVEGGAVYYYDQHSPENRPGPVYGVPAELLNQTWDYDTWLAQERAREDLEISLWQSNPNPGLFDTARIKSDGTIVEHQASLDRMWDMVTGLAGGRKITKGGGLSPTHKFIPKDDGLPHSSEMLSQTFPKPPVPSGPHSRKVGEVLGFGTGKDVPGLQRTFTKESLQQNGITKEVAEQWRDVYRWQVENVPKNPAAPGRLELMERILKILE